MKTNHITLSKKLLSIILLTLFVLPIYGQTEKPLSEFEQRIRKAAELYEKKDLKNYLSELETLLKLASTKEERVNANRWLAGYYQDQKDFTKAIPYYEEVLKLDEKNLGAIEILGNIYSNDPNLEIKTKKALPLLLKAEQLGTTSSGIYYNISCIYSLQKEIEKAIQYLDKAIYHGYDNIEWMQKDSDFDNIRKTEYYTRLVSNWEKVKLGQEAMSEGKKAEKVANYDLALQSFLKAEELFIAVVGKDSLLVAFSSNWAGGVYKSKGEYDKAIEYYTKSLAIFIKTLGGEHPNVATSYSNLGSFYKSKGEYDKAIEYYTKSLAIRLKTLGGEHPDVATSYNNLGSVYDSKGEYDKAIEYYTKSLAIFIKTLGGEHPNVATSYNNLGSVYESKGEYDKAIEYYTKSLAILIKTLGGEHPDVATSYNNLGSVYKSKGEYDKAIEYYTKDLAISLKTLGGEHPNVATSYNNLGSVYKSKGEYDKAIEYYTKSLAIFIKTLEGEHPSVATSYNNLGSVYKSKGEYDKAIEYYTKDLAISLKTLGGEHPDVATSYNNLGLVYKSKGEYDKAIEYYTKSLAIFIKTLGGEHPDVATSYNNLGSVYDSKGEYDKAIEYYTKSLAIYIKTLGGEHPYVALSYWNIGVAYKSKKDFPKAIEYIQKAIHIYEKSEERDNYINTYITLKEVHVEQKQTDMAIDALKKALELVLKFRQKMGQDKTAFTQRHLSVFTELIRLYQETNQPEKAFEISEKMRGLSMMEDFQKHLALIRSGIPKDKSDEFLSLQKNLESLYSQKTALLRNSKTPQLAIDNMKNTISERERTLAAMENEFEKKYPEYATLKKIQFPSISELKKQLTKRDANIVEYVLATDKEGKEWNLSMRLSLAPKASSL
jgi:tetratricopeptide (TPR) repeat protein